MSGPRSQVNYWKSKGSWIDDQGQTRKGAWCCWLRGKQHTLAVGPNDAPHGPAYNKALRAFSELHDLGNADLAKDRNTVDTICELYLRHIEKKRNPRSVKIRKRCLTPFVAALGKTTVKDLTQHAVDRWLETMQEWRKHPGTGRPTRWEDGSIRNAIASLQACFNWATTKNYISKNPLKGMEQPPARSRGREALIGATAEERTANHLRILAECTPALGQLVIVLEATGCRPGELVYATANGFDAKLGALVYHADDKRLASEFRHKTAGKGKDRIIFLTGEALEIVRQLVKQHPTGPLFRTSKGHRLHKHLEGRSGWTQNTLDDRFRVIRERLGLPNLTPYSYRHTFATAWLEKGKSVDVLAELMGNSPAVIRKHYSHLLSDAANLRRQLEAFRAGRSESEDGPIAAASGAVSQEPAPT